MIELLKRMKKIAYKKNIEKRAEKLWKGINLDDDHLFWVHYGKLLKESRRKAFSPVLVSVYQAKQTFRPPMLVYLGRIFLLVAGAIVFLSLLFTMFREATGIGYVVLAIFMSSIFLYIFLIRPLLFLDELRIFTVSDTGLFVSGIIGSEPTHFAWENVLSIKVEDWRNPGSIPFQRLAIEVESQVIEVCKYHLTKNRHKLFAQALKKHSVDLKCDSKRYS